MCLISLASFYETIQNILKECAKQDQHLDEDNDRLGKRRQKVKEKRRILEGTMKYIYLMRRDRAEGDSMIGELIVQLGY